ncbi:hypothetical protein BO78DRAFT_397338, partial [Aspergillus sclerotiicarbonarius CBS 121057]
MVAIAAQGRYPRITFILPAVLRSSGPPICAAAALPSQWHNASGFDWHVPRIERNTYRVGAVAHQMGSRLYSATPTKAAAWFHPSFLPLLNRTF